MYKTLVALLSPSLLPLRERVLAARHAWSAFLAQEAGQRWHTCLFWFFWLSLASFPIGYGMREVLPVVCFLFLLLYYRHCWQKSVLYRLSVRPLFYCLWAMIAIGIFFSGNVWASLLHAGTGINKAFILPFIAMECARSETDLRRLVWACVVAVFWQGLDGLWQFHTGSDLIMGYSLNAGRLTGSLGDYTVGNYVALSMIPAFSLWFILRQRLNAATAAVLWLVVLWPAFFLLVGAGSRSGLLAVAAAPGMWFVLRKGRGWPWKLCLVPVLLLTSLAFFAPRPLNPDYVLDDGRWSLWHMAWRIFEENPWFGAGAGQFNAAFRALNLTPEKDDMCISHPHDLYLDMLYAHGLVGFSLGLVFLLGFLYWGLQHIRPHLALECAQEHAQREAGAQGTGQDDMARLAKQAGQGQQQGSGLYWRLAAWFWIGYAAWLVNGIFAHDFYRTWWLGLAMSHLGVMIGAVVNGPAPAGPPPQSSGDSAFHAR